LGHSYFWDDDVVTITPEPSLVWPSPGPFPPLNPATIHVWAWPLNAAADDDAAGALPAKERERAQRFVSAHHRQRFIAAHIGMRHILARYLQVEPGAIDFEAGKHGKPRLAGDSPLQFNLSHSRDVALLAISDDIEVGVDVEFIHPVGEGIAERFFAPSEVSAIAALPRGERLAGFYTCWTRKEAFLKGTGLGLSGGAALDSFAVSLHTTASLAGQSPITAGWKLDHLEPAHGYVGALAFKAAKCTVHCFSYALP
jgi:4'-phosphopantetheinyl transferase